MINYIEKGIGLHDAIHVQGHSLSRLDGAWVADDETAVQAIIDAYTVAQSAELIASAIDAHAKALRDPVVANISPAEMASWFIKRAEAIAYTASNNAVDAPNLNAEAQARGISLADLVVKVGTKGASLAQLESVVAGVCGKHVDAAKACATFAELFAYNWRTGWPEV